MYMCHGSKRLSLVGNVIARCDKIEHLAVASDWRQKHVIVEFNNVLELRRDRIFAFLSGFDVENVTLIENRSILASILSTRDDEIAFWRQRCERHRF